MDEGNQMIQTSSYKTNKYWGCNVQHDKYNEHNCMLHMKVKRVNPESSHHTQKFFSIYSCIYMR